MWTFVFYQMLQYFILRAQFSFVHFVILIFYHSIMVFLPYLIFSLVHFTSFPLNAFCINESNIIFSSSLDCFCFTFSFSTCSTMEAKVCWRGRGGRGISKLLISFNNKFFCEEPADWLIKLPPIISKKDLRKIEVIYFLFGLIIATLF